MRRECVRVWYDFDALAVEEIGLLLCGDLHPLQFAHALQNKTFKCNVKGVRVSRALGHYRRGKMAIKGVGTLRQKGDGN